MALQEKITIQLTVNNSLSPVFTFFVVASDEASVVGCVVSFCVLFVTAFVVSEDVAVVAGGV